MDTPLDDSDYRLLELLQEDARTPMSRLAELVDLSEPACYRRVQRLKREKVIEREVAVVSPRTMGWPLTMIVLVTLERERAATIDQFIRKLQSVPEILESLVRHWRLRLRIESRGTGHGKLRDADSQRPIRRQLRETFKTLVTMRNVKTQGPIKRRP